MVESENKKRVGREDKAAIKKSVWLRNFCPEEQTDASAKVGTLPRATGDRKGAGNGNGGGGHKTAQQKGRVGQRGVVGRGERPPAVLSKRGLCAC